MQRLRARGAKPAPLPNITCCRNGRRRLLPHQSGSPIPSPADVRPARHAMLPPTTEDGVEAAPVPCAGEAAGTSSGADPHSIAPSGDPASVRTLALLTSELLAARELALLTAAPLAASTGGAGVG